MNEIIILIRYIYTNKKTNDIDFFHIRKTIMLNKN